VHLTLFPKPEEIAPANSAQIISDWEKLLQLRAEVLVKLEALRAEKVIGKALEAIVTLPADSAIDNSVTGKYEDSLPELFNVSEVDIAAGTDATGISVERSPETKCDRCWRYTDDVGQNDAYPTVCLRCAEALDAIDFPPYTAASN
jgi:isoleucyl-tRNA synthetase